MKKKHLFLILFTNLILAQELVPNPSFESWINTNPPYPTTWNCAYCSKGAPNSGTYSVQLNLPSSSSSTSFNTNSKVLNIIAGKTYTVSYYYNTSSTDIKSSIINVYKSSGSRFFYGNESSLIKDGQWHKYVGTFTADISDLGKIDISATITYGLIGNISYDDVSIIDSSLSINETNKNNIEIYPTYITDFVYFSEPVKIFDVYSIDGKKINLEYSENKINFIKQTKGIYIITGLTKSNQVFSKKIIKK